MEIITVLDIETTNLKPWNGIIVEIGICTLNLRSGKIEEKFSAICHENKEYDKSAWIFNNSDLTTEQVDDANPLESYRETIQNLLNQYTVTAYNQNFDFSFLRDREFQIKKRFWDPMKKLTPILKLPNYRGYYYKWPSVQEAWDYFFPESDYRENHRALDDAIHEAKIIYETNKLIKNMRR